MKSIQIFCNSSLHVNMFLKLLRQWCNCLPLITINVKFGPYFMQQPCYPSFVDGMSPSKWQWALSRMHLKFALLGGNAGFSNAINDTTDDTSILFSECDECAGVPAIMAGFGNKLKAIEEKLDLLLQYQMALGTKPNWAEQSEGRMLSAIHEIQTEMIKLSSEDNVLKSCSARLRQELSDLAEGADKFLAGLSTKLGDKDRQLFFELIVSIEDANGRRVRTYEEIGTRMKISKQAVQQRYRRISVRIPEFGDYVEAIRRPVKPQYFSEMSPSDRRNQGVDSCYDHTMD